MTTSLTSAPRERAEVETPSSRRGAARGVLPVAVALVVAQLGFRAWATYASSWFTFDDFTFMSKMANEGATPDIAAQGYSGHLMPAGMYLSWLADQVAPYDFTIVATMLMVMQVVANVGAVVLLVRLFGVRWGILPPLALYLFCVTSAQVAIWWAAGVNQIPLQIVLFWGLAAHVQYLRTNRTRHLVVAALTVVGGLLFYEKTILVLGAYGIVTLAYFATGDLRSRLQQVWERYRGAVVLYVVLGLAYLAFYAQWALNFSPHEAGNDALGEVVTNMVFEGYLPATLGGPLQWDRLSQWSLPSPSDLVVLASLAIWFLLIREIQRSRTRSLRAWYLPIFFLGCDILLVLAGRASFVGAIISRDLRYQGELPAVTAIALACATMPIIGALEQVTVRRQSALLDHPRRVAAATAAMVVLALVSSISYITYWSDTMQAKPYFTRLIGTLEKAKDPIPIVDEQVPDFVMWGLGYPANLLSHLLLPYQQHIDFRSVATDHLNVVDETGAVVPAGVTDVRRNTPGPREGCGYSVEREAVSIPLDGPLAFGGWWVRIGYLSSGDSPAVVSAGSASYSVVLKPGVHALYLEGGTEFDSVEVSGLAPGVSMCTDDVVAGRIVPFTELRGVDVMTDTRPTPSAAEAAAFTDRSFPALNAVRAVGALMVVLTHAAFNTGRINDGWIGAALARFDFGVTLFFVLSGFLLSRPWFLAAALGRQGPSTRHYLWKRALRILPLYWVVVVAAFLIDPANEDATWQDWVSHLTLTQIYRHDLLASSLTQMWSLCTEVLFYLVLPLICVVLTGRRPRTLRLNRVLIGAGVISLAGLAWQVVMAQVPGREGHYGQWLPGYLPWFMIGLAFAAISASLAAHPREHVLNRIGADVAGCWILAVGVFALACSPLAGPRLLLTPTGWEAGTKVILYAVAGAFFVLPLVFGPEREGSARRQLGGPVPTWLGEISYGIFAIHMIVLNLVFRFLDLGVFTGRFITVALLTLAITVVLATISFYLFEKPILRLKNVRFFARMEPARTVAPPPEIAP